MTKYALPAILGGQEMDGEAHGDGMILDVPGYGNLLMPAHYVTEVPPEVPPEDPTGTVWCNGVDVWIRHDVVGTRDDGGHWWGTDTGRLHGYRLWKEVAPIVAGPGWRRWAPVEDEIQALAERDNLQALANRFVTAVEALTGEDFGEWTSSNDPALNALAALPNTRERDLLRGQVVTLLGLCDGLQRMDGYDDIWASVTVAEIRKIFDGFDHVGSTSDKPCGSCGGTRWVDDENWQPEDWELARGRVPGSGRIPCGICNHGGWNEPDGTTSGRASYTQAIRE